MPKIRVLIADDHSVIRDGLASLLAMEPDIEVVGHAENGPGAVDRCLALRPDVVLMDIRMPQLDGMEATRQIRGALPDTQIIVLSSYDGEEYLKGALREGAVGYILKDAPFTEVANGVRAVARGETLLHPRMARRLVEQFGALLRERKENPAPHILSDREVDVLRLLAAGLSNRGIGERLFISEKTVKKHVGHIMRKLGASGRAQAVLTAVQLGLLRLPQ